MAIVSYNATKAAARSINVGVTGVSDIYSNLRKYDQTARILSMERVYAPLFTVLSTKLPRIKVADPEPRIWMDAPHEGVFTVGTSQTSANYFLLNLGTTNIRFIKVGDMLTVVGVWFRSSATINAADWTTTRGSNNNDSVPIYAPEMLRVTSVDYVAGTCTIARGDGVQTGTCTTLLTTSMKVMLSGNSQAENSGVPVPLSTQPMYDDNYTQIFKEAWGMSNTERKTESWIGSGEAELARRAAKARRKMAQEIERALLFGRKAKTYDATGMAVRMTGGLEEFVQDQSGSLQDGLPKFFDLGDNTISLTGLYTSGGLYSLTEKLFQYGNAEKWAGVGQSFLTEYNSLFPNMIRVNQELTNKLKMNVSDFETAHGVLHFVHEPVLTIMSGTGTDQDYNRQMCIVDTEYIDIMELDPIHVEENVQSPGTDGVLHQLKGELGFLRRYPDAHSFVYGIAATS